MNQSTLDLEVKTLQIQNEKLFRAIEEVQSLLQNPEEQNLLVKEFYTIEDCAKLKGGAALNTYKASRFLLPGCGNSKYAAYIAGRLCFPKEEVIRWLKVTDAQYLDYAKECGITIIPEKFLKLAKKANGKLEVI